MGCTVKMNKINDRDLTELSSYWVYQNIDIKKEFIVNGKRFKQIDSYTLINYCLLTSWFTFII